MFLEEWRDSEEYERRQEDIEIANMDSDEQEPVWARPVESPVSLPPPSPPPPDDGGDPFGGASADIFYDKLGDSGDECAPQPREPPRVRVQLRVHHGRSVEVQRSACPRSTTRMTTSKCANRSSHGRSAYRA